MTYDETRPTIHERVGRALASGNMRQREGACDLDKVGALGMVGITETLAAAVFRLKYGGEHRSYDDALSGVYRLSRALDARQRWRLRRGTLHRMSKSVLDYWLMDNCPLCTGLGYEIAEGAHRLTDRVCLACQGSRKKEMPWLRRIPNRPEGRRAKHKRIERWKEVCVILHRRMDRHRHLLVELEKVERAIGDKMIAKLASEARTL